MTAVAIDARTHEHSTGTGGRRDAAGSRAGGEKGPDFREVVRLIGWGAALLGLLAALAALGSMVG